MDWGYKWYKIYLMYIYHQKGLHANGHYHAGDQDQRLLTALEHLKMEPPELDRLVHPVAAVDRRQESVALLAEQLRHGAEQQGVRGEGHQEGQHVGEPHDPHLPEEQEVADGALATGCGEELHRAGHRQGFLQRLHQPAIIFR